MFCKRIFQRNLSRSMLLLAVFSAAAVTEASAGPMIPAPIHREVVEASQSPGSAVGKLFNETGGSCSGVAISRTQIVTAAHCLFDQQTRQFISAGRLQFLAGYRMGRFTADVRIARYEVGPGFDPERPGQTAGSDWAVLTVAEDMPDQVEPLRVRHEMAAVDTLKNF